VLAFSRLDALRPYLEAGQELPTFEVAGPRRRIFFDPTRVTAGIVTCGGLCPGQNDVVRAVVLTLTYGYGVPRVLGFRHGYAGLGARPIAEPVLLDTAAVRDIHRDGGTLLGSSRGSPSTEEMVDTLVARGVDMLFAVGGDGTLRGASALVREIRRRNLAISVVGVPKTIDNDICWVERSFGFATAVEEARRAILAAHVEARGAWNGIGLVKLMGRHSGFIAAHATLANNDVNFCLVPEIPFTLEGPTGLLAEVQRRIERRHHAVLVVAEGAGQEHVGPSGQRDPSGNAVLRDVGGFLKQRLEEHFAASQVPVTIKYIDPSYMVRSLPASANDAEFCLMLGQDAVHAAMAGCTDLLVGYWNQSFVHLPIALATAGRKRLEPDGATWQAVLQTTGQPSCFGPPCR
jgi:6-phosphofructokinase 1